MTSILTPADIAAYAPELDLSSFTTATISGMLSQATLRAAAFCGVAGFDFQTVVDETDRTRISIEGDLQVSVLRRPIVTISGISLVRGSFSTSMVLTQNGTNLYQIPTPGNKVVMPNSYLYLTGTFLAGGSSQLLTLRSANTFYKITYAGGYQTIPDDLKYAVILYFRDIYAQRAVGANGAPLAGFTQGSYSENYAGGSKSGKSFLVQQAESALMNSGYARLEF